MTAEQSEIEFRLLTTLWFDKEVRAKLMPTVLPQFFTSSASSKEMASAIREMHLKNEQFDPVVLRQRLFGSQTASGAVFEGLVNEKNRKNSTTLGGANVLVVALKRNYFNTISKTVAGRIDTYTTDGKHTSQDIIKMTHALQRVHKELFSAKSENHTVTAVERINAKDEYVPSIFPWLNENIGGFTKKDMSSIGGKSGHNKTTFSFFNLTQIVKHGIIKKGLYISADEPGDMLMRRAIANELDISLTDMRQKRVILDKRDTENAIRAVYGDRLIILDNIFTPDEVSNAILDIKPDQVIIDHIQELRFPGEDGISESGITYTLKLCKEAARISGANVTVLSQVKDKLIDERFEDKIPRPHDFYYASTIRQKSREQCVVYWKFQDSREDHELTDFFFIIYKSTYSPLLTVKFKYEPDKARFYEVKQLAKLQDASKTEMDWSKYRAEEI